MEVTAALGGSGTAALLFHNPFPFPLRVLVELGDAPRSASRQNSEATRDGIALLLADPVVDIEAAGSLEVPVNIYIYIYIDR